MNEFMESKTILSSASPQIELNNQGETIKFNLTESFHFLGREPNKPEPVGLVVPQNWEVVSRVQAYFRKEGEDYYIYDGDGVTPSANRLFIENRNITPKKGHRLVNGDQLRIGQSPLLWVLITYTNPVAQKQKIKPPSQRSFSLVNQSVLLGRGTDANICLDSPIVSRKHATIDSDGKGNYVLQNYSPNGVYINTEKVDNSSLLKTGDLIRIGPYSLVLRENLLLLLDEDTNIRLDAKSLVKEVKIKNKQNLRILNDISLVIEPGQLVALVGGSGAGKSTLMKVLLGIEKITHGNIYLNGDDLKKYFNVYRSLIGYVPQSDIVHTNLTVSEVLYYAAKLRLPPDADIKEVIQKTLGQVELIERQNTLVRSLSGGQLKRVSIAVELLADPKLFFLDEPTSGLDPGLDKKMMQLLRSLADEGRTVVLVTHATNNITLCNRLAFLGLGGYLCYYGPPAEATTFFNLESGDFADIYNKLESKELVIEQAYNFHNSSYQKDYIDDRLILEEKKEQAILKPSKGSFLRQLITLMQRYIKLISRDRTYLILSLLTAPVGILLVRIALHDDSPYVGTATYLRASLATRTIFIFTCAAVWAGFASSLQEIVKESAIYLRERLVNLGLFSYLSSKVVVLTGLTILQTLLISAVILVCFKSPELDSIPWSFDNLEPHLIVPWFIGLIITTFLTILASFSLGLLVSASVKNSTQANSALPLLLLPQIILAGILFEVKGVSEWISWLMLSRWSVAAYGAILGVNSLLPVPAKDATDIPINALSMFDATSQNILLNWGILLLHTVVYLAITLWVQKRKDAQ